MEYTPIKTRAFNDIVIMIINIPLGHVTPRAPEKNQAPLNAIYRFS